MARSATGNVSGLEGDASGPGGQNCRQESGQILLQAGHEAVEQGSQSHRRKTDQRSIDH